MDFLTSDEHVLGYEAWQDTEFIIHYLLLQLHMDKASK